MLKDLSYLLDQTHQMASRKSKLRGEKEATVGASHLGHFGFMIYHLRNGFKSFKGEVNQGRSKSAKEKSKSAS